MVHFRTYVCAYREMLCACALSLTLSGCNAFPQDYLVKRDEEGATPDTAEVGKGGIKPKPPLRTDRYSLVDTRPSESQVEPLSAYISVNFGEGVSSVGDALFELLRGSGYQIFYHDFHSCELSRKLLFARELPISLRNIGPMSVRDALETVIGQAWGLQIFELDRTLSFHVREAYRDKVIADPDNQAAPNFELDRQPQSRFSIAFNTGEFHAPSQGAHKIISEAARRAVRLSARLLVRGHAHSSGHWATEAQALRRAKTVRTLLIGEGVDPATIKLATSVSNDNDPLRQMPNGAELLLYSTNPGEASKNGTVGLDCAGVHSEVKDAQQKPTTNVVFTVQAGSLRRNIERLLQTLGLRMGKWDLADGRYEYDWEIPHNYTIPITTADQALHSLLGSYGIQPILNLLDNSVDFVTYHKSFKP